MSEVFIGIDPGAKGAIVGLWGNGTTAFIFTLEDIHWLCCFLKDLKVNQGTIEYKVGLEKAQAHPGQGVVSMFNYGLGYGQIQGALTALGFGYTLIAPQRWTKAMHVGTKKVGSTAKKRSLEAAKRLAPYQDFRDPDKPKSKVSHDGIVDAWLIAEFLRRQYARRV